MHHTKRPHLRPAVALLLMLLPFVALSCSGEESDTSGAADVTVEDAALTDTASVTDTAPPTDTPAATDAGPSESCPGGAGCPCSGNDDCDAGLCIEAPGGRQCAGRGLPRRRQDPELRIRPHLPPQQNLRVALRRCREPPWFPTRS